jgi:hypothetical protein
MLIADKHYNEAVAYLESADAKRQAMHDTNGYAAVAKDDIILPSVDSGVWYDRSRDWEMPGTSDCVESVAWQEAATRFAEEYNRQRGRSVPKP